MTVAQARALCAELELLDWDDVAIARGITEVTARLLAASPQVTPAAGEPGLWWVGAGGFEGIGGERELARALLAIARRWHPRARVAVADSCVAARAATWAGGRDASAFVIPAGGDAAYLATAPLALIPMDEELRATLLSLGIATAGAFAALEGEDVERRWGSAGLAAWRLARGEDLRRPVLASVQAARVVEAELAAPTTTMEPILFLVRAALERLSAALAAEGRAAAAVAITLTLDGARSALPSGTSPHTVTREVRLPHPVARATHLLEHCRALLDNWPLTTPACGVAVAIVATVSTSAHQGDLLTDAWRDHAAVDAAFARLRTELGPQAVVRPVVCDEHRPERSGAWVEAGVERRASGTGVMAPAAGEQMHATRTLTLRLLESPEEIDVEWSGGRLCAIWWRGQRLTVERASGPERLSGDWWKDSYRREYWRCEAEVGELLLFTEEGRWCVHGWYD